MSNVIITSVIIIAGGDSGRWLYIAFFSSQLRHLGSQDDQQRHDMYTAERSVLITE